MSVWEWADSGDPQAAIVSVTVPGRSSYMLDATDTAQPKQVRVVTLGPGRQLSA